MVRRSSYFCYGSIVIVQRAGDPMQDTRSTTSVESAKRIAVRRRAKRGLVAGYIHELSSRHGSPAAPQKPAEPAPQPARAS
jgi:hypothetical protein